MPEPLNPKVLQQLEGELAQAEKRGDNLEALDILEDINRRGWAQARHMLALGNCYMTSRQRQDAKRCWMQAYALDPNMQAVLQTLDKNFPGWQTQPPPTAHAHPAAPSAAPHSGDEPPPPPPPANFGAPRPALSIETVAPPRHEAPVARPSATAHTAAPGAVQRPAPAAPVSPIAPPARRPPPQEPLPDLDAAFETQTRGEPVLTRSGPPGTLPSFEVGGRGLTDHTGKVNWRLVLEEATEIAGG